MTYAPSVVKGLRRLPTDLAVGPDPGGYAGRDPKTDMPSVPSVPSVPDDERESGGVNPPSGSDRPAHD